MGQRMQGRGGQCERLQVGSGEARADDGGKAQTRHVAVRRGSSQLSSQSSGGWRWWWDDDEDDEQHQHQHQQHQQ